MVQVLQPVFFQRSTSQRYSNSTLGFPISPLFGFAKYKTL
jgi:hypothetical protein